MGQTVSEKIISKAAGLTEVKPGDVVTCSVDLAMIHDSGGPRRVKQIMEKLGANVWDPNKVVLVSDHFAHNTDSESMKILQLTRDWAKGQKIHNFYDQEGICHIVTPERGHLLPGMFAVGGDSHSPTGGAFGCFMFGVGSTDMLGILVTGKTWVKVPETININWSGSLKQGVVAKDMALRMCAALGMNGGAYQAIQYTGDAVQSLSMTERMTLCNMSAELGAQTGIIAPDEITYEYIREAGGHIEDENNLISDDDANYLIKHEFSANDLEPQVATPHSPANSTEIKNIEKVQVDKFYIGACTGAKLVDLSMAAKILKNNKVAAGKQLTVAPASSKIYNQASENGVMSILTEAGAKLLPPGCGACAGYGAGVLENNEVCLASTARNFQGRMGSSTSHVYLGSPYTVAASAVTGTITDPREFLED